MWGKGYRCGGGGGGAAGWYGFDLVVRKQEIHPEAWVEEALLGVHLVVKGATWLQPFKHVVSLKACT